MNLKFSPRIKDVLSYSKEEAERLDSEIIGTEHLFLGILRDGEGIAVDVLISYDINLQEFRESIENKLSSDSAIADDLQKAEQENVPLNAAVEKVLKLIYLEAKAMQHDIIDTGHLLLAIMKDKKCFATQLLEMKDITYNKIKESIITLAPKAQSDYPPEDDEARGGLKGDNSKKIEKSRKDTPVLDNFGIDITKAAEEGTLDPIVGREVEIERLAQILSRRKKNNPVLIGEPGVGKSAIAEGLALRIVQKKVSRILFGKRVVTLDLASIVAGTKYRGQFEERMKAILNELSKTTDIILFIDEIHTIVGAGGATGSLDAANMLKPALARGEIQCIGATTLDEYRQNIEKDGALERRFQKIMVEPTSPEETVIILQNIKERYEDHHSVFYTDDAIDACVKLTNRYISDRYLPDKAIDALDEAGSRVHISNIQVPVIVEELEKNIEKTRKNKVKAVKAQNFELAASFRDKEKNFTEELEKEKEKWELEMSRKRETVDAENIAEVVAMMTGVPVKRIAQAEGARLMQMNNELREKVIGQDEAIGKIVKSIQRNRAGLKNPNKPIGTFMFLGPTGVGKTQLAKILSEYLFDSTDALIRIDMSEYMEKFAVSRLVGAPPGYVGYEEGGQLTEKVRRKPYSVILLDEIEKAHPDVFNILLQVLDDGQLTDSLGRRVDFKNTIIIMTSNIGSRELKDFGKGIGFETGSSRDATDGYARNVIFKALKRAFVPEFLNRLDDVVMFNSLSKENIYKIIDIELKGVYKRVHDLGYNVEISDEAKDFVAEKGYDVQYGARPLKRAIQKYLEDEMAEIIIKSAINEGDTILVSLDKNKKNIEMKIQKRKKELKK